MLKAKSYLERAGLPWWIWGLILIGLGLSWVIVSLDSLGSTQQILIVLALVLVLLASLVYLIKPHIIVNLFIFAIPLLIGQTEVAAGLNLGELATLFIMSLSIITLLTSSEKLVEGYRQLRPLIWPLLGLALIGVISALVNGVSSLPEITASVFKPLAFAMVTLLVLMHNDSPKKMESLIKALLFGGFAVAAYSIIAYAMGWSYYPEYGYSRAAGTFEHWNQLGGYMVLIIFPTLAYALSVKHFWVRIAFLLAFMTETVALLLSLTLGSLFSLLISGSIALFLLFRLSATRAVGFAFMLALVFFSIWLTTPLLESRLNEVGDRVLDRLSTYAAGFQIARDHFWFGLGSQDRVLETILYAPAGYRFTPFGETSYIPHNSLLSVWVEKGIFGLLLFIIVIVSGLRLILRAYLSRDSRYHMLHQGIVAGILGFLIQNMTNNLLLHPRIGFIFFALLIVAYRTSYSNNYEGPQGKAL